MQRVACVSLARRSVYRRLDVHRAAHITPRRPPSQALVDGPETLTGVRRHVINFKWIALTDFTVDAPRNARQKTLEGAWKTAQVKAKWEASAWGKKLAAKSAKLALTDFQRFEAKVKKQTAMKKVRASLK